MDMVELQVINKILNTKDYSLILNNNLTEDYFANYSAEFLFLKNHFNKFKQVPDVETFLLSFPDFNYINNVEESDSYLLEELNKGRNARHLRITFNNIRQLLIDNKITEAMDVYKNAINSLSDTTQMKTVDLFKDVSRYEAYVERTKDFSKYFVKTGFKEIDNIIGGWDREEELATIVARTNNGKCLAKGTGVLMADGSIKKVEDVLVGDKVQSFNRVNTVLGLHNGISNGYKIIPNKGEPFIISSNHILTLFNTEKECLEDISIEDFIEISTRKKLKYKLFFPDINYPHKEYLISPYDMGNKLVSTHNYSIPLSYLTGDREQRLELLAGILDMRGIFSYNDNYYEINLKSMSLLKNIVQLVRGLGLRSSSIRKIETTKKKIASYRIRIYGDLSVIPTKKHLILPKTTNTKISQFQLTGFKIESVPKVEYYGFMCDGDSRYILENGILTHNTWILLKCAVAAVQQGLNVGIYSGEMSEKKIGYRVDTLLGHLSNGSLIHGNKNIINDYKKYIDNLPNLVKGSLKVLTPQMINGPAGVGALRAFIRKEKLDILFIDQHSLLSDDRHAKNPVEKASNISLDLKNLQVMEKIPIISVAQQNRLSSEDGVSTTMIAQSDRIGQDSTCVIFLTKKDDIMEFNFVKLRDGSNGKKISYQVNLDKGEFLYIPDENDLNAESQDFIDTVDNYSERYNVSYQNSSTYSTEDTTPYEGEDIF